jgi:hypothetical protein
VKKRKRKKRYAIREKSIIIIGLHELLFFRGLYAKEFFGDSFIVFWFHLQSEKRRGIGRREARNGERETKKGKKEEKTEENSFKKQK